MTRLWGKLHKRTTEKLLRKMTKMMRSIASIQRIATLWLWNNLTFKNKESDQNAFHHWILITYRAMNQLLKKRKEKTKKKVAKMTVIHWQKKMHLVRNSLHKIMNTENHSNILTIITPNRDSPFILHKKKAIKLSLMHPSKS